MRGFRPAAVTGLFMIWLLAACQTAPAATVVPTLPSDVGQAILWTRDPYNVIFRTDVLGGERATRFEARGDIPYCTIYGDNRVLWVTNDAEGFQEYLEDRLADEVIREFVADLTVDERLFTYNTGTPDPSLTPEPIPPVVETISINVNGIPYSTNAFDGWSSDFYLRILDRCRTLSTAPALYQPLGAWLSAQTINNNGDLYVLNWDAAATGIDLANLASSSQGVWVTGETLARLWNSLYQTSVNVFFSQGEATYELALQIPGATRNAPRPPA